MKFISVLFLMFVSVLARAGETGGGGNVVKCDLPNGKHTYQLLDLYLAEKVFNLKMPVAQPGVDYFKYASDRLTKLLDAGELSNYQTSTGSGVGGGAISGTYEFSKAIQDHVHLVATGINLKPRVDYVLPIQLPNNCHIIQTINYIDDNTILGASDILSKLDAVNTAALYFHEALYRVTRLISDPENSNRVMRVIGQLFAENMQLEPLYAGIPTDALECSGYTLPKENGYSAFADITNVGYHATMFFAWFDQSVGKVQIQFVWLNGLPVFSKKTLTEGTAFDFEGMKNTDLETGSDIHIQGQTDSKFESADTIAITKTAPWDGTSSKIRTIKGFPSDDKSSVFENTMFSCYPLVPIKK